MTLLPARLPFNKQSPQRLRVGVILYKFHKAVLVNVHLRDSFVHLVWKNFGYIVGFAKIVIEIKALFVYNDFNVAQATVTATVEGGGFPERRTNNNVHCKFYP